MHPEAALWLQGALQRVTLPLTPAVLELGSRDVNGSLRGLVPGAAWLGVDIGPGPGVDLVADARTLRLAEMASATQKRFDLVVCTEVLEHVDGWAAIVETIGLHLHPRGAALITAACHPRAPHGARSPDGTMEPDEYYGNVDPEELDRALCKWASEFEISTDPNHGDVYAIAYK